MKCDLVGHEVVLLDSVYMTLWKRGVVTCPGGKIVEGPGEFDDRYTLEMDDGRLKKFNRMDFHVIIGESEPEPEHEFVGDYEGMFNEVIMHFDVHGQYHTFSIGCRDDEHDTLVTLTREGLTNLVRDLTLYLKENPEREEKQ